jgi:hypothetical protein
LMRERERERETGIHKPPHTIKGFCDSSVSLFLWSFFRSSSQSQNYKNQAFSISYPITVLGEVYLA